MLPVFDEVVPLVVPQLGIGLARHGRLSEQNEDLRQIGNVNVIPARLALADDGDVAA